MTNNKKISPWVKLSKKGKTIIKNWPKEWFSSQFRFNKRNPLLLKRSRFSCISTFSSDGLRTYQFVYNEIEILTVIYYQHKLSGSEGSFQFCINIAILKFLQPDFYKLYSNSFDGHNCFPDNFNLIRRKLGLYFIIIKYKHICVNAINQFYCQY